MSRLLWEKEQGCLELQERFTTESQPFSEVLDPLTPTLHSLFRGALSRSRSSSNDLKVSSDSGIRDFGWLACPEPSVLLLELGKPVCSRKE